MLKNAVFPPPGVVVEIRLRPDGPRSDPEVGGQTVEVVEVDDVVEIRIALTSRGDDHAGAIDLMPAKRRRKAREDRARLGISNRIPGIGGGE